MSIELQFVLGRGISSRLIAWYGQGYGGYSHVDARLPDGRLAGARSDRVGGQPSGFHVRPENYEEWKRRTIVSIPCTPEEKEQWLRLIDEKIGCPYDKADIIGLIIGRRLETAGAWICSAAQFDILQALSKFPSRFPFIKAQISPNSLLGMCCCIGGATYGDHP